MEKELLILTKSSKHHAYCVVGYDIKTKQLIRLTSSDEQSNNSLLRHHLTYNNGKEVECQDVVKVELLTKVPKEIHKEDWLINEDIKFTKVRNGNINELNSIIKVNSGLIFENDKEYLTFEEAKRQNQSIIVAYVENIELYTVQNYDRSKLKTKVNFTYNNKQYNHFSVTDPKFYNKNQKYKKAIIVFSLPDSSDIWCIINNKFYKYVAKIFLI